MEKRKMENIGAEPSMLGFGCMRFPTLEDGSINEAEAEKMLNYALDHGVTYVDTAYFYHDGASEPFVGKVLEKRDRSSFYLATKLPVWILKDGEDARRVCMEQLSRLRTEYVDFYLLHALNRERWEKLVEQGVIDVPLRYNYDKPEKPRISRIFGYLARFFILFQTEKSSREVVIS